jgi:hypothetical protein
MVHLDFHTGPQVPDVAKDFDAREFARTFRDAHVDSVTVFAKCHHGHLYYRTDHPARHPSLPKGLDLLDEQIEALHSVGIRAPIYLSVHFDEFAANTHPEWLIVGADGKLDTPGPLHAGWQILDMSSPYQDYLADQLAEVLRRFAPVDGIFLDICWDRPSASKWAKDAMLRAGLDPRLEADRAAYARRLAHQYMARYHKMVEQAQKGHAPAEDEPVRGEEVPPPHRGGGPAHRWLGVRVLPIRLAVRAAAEPADAQPHGPVPQELGRQCGPQAPCGPPVRVLPDPQPGHDLRRGRPAPPARRAQ